MKTNHLFLTLAAAALLCCGSASAQKATPRKQPDAGQRIERQVERMQKRLLLDDETAAKFAPLYKEYIEKLAACRRTHCGKRRGNLTDAEIDARMQEGFAAQKKAIETKEAYYHKFKKILNIRQLEQIFGHKPLHHMPRKPHKAGKHHPARHCPPVAAATAPQP